MRSPATLLRLADHYLTELRSMGLELSKIDDLFETSSAFRQAESLNALVLATCYQRAKRGEQTDGYMFAQHLAEEIDLLASDYLPEDPFERLLVDDVVQNLCNFNQPRLEKIGTRGRPVGATSTNSGEIASAVCDFYDVGSVKPALHPLKAGNEGMSGSRGTPAAAVSKVISVLNPLLQSVDVSERELKQCFKEERRRRRRRGITIKTTD